MKSVLWVSVSRRIVSVFCLVAVLLIGCSTSPSSGTNGSPNPNAKAESHKPVLPIDVTFRPAKNDAGFAATYINKSDEFLELVVSLENPTDDSNNRTILLNIGPRQSIVRQQEEGIGFAYKSGDKIVITNANYAPLKITVP